MKNYFALALAVALPVLGGCDISMTADRVEYYTNKCTQRGGTPLVMKLNNGMVDRIRCEIDGNVYRMGDY